MRLPLLQDYENGSLYGMEKFWAFHHYHGLPKSSGLEINSKVTPLPTSHAPF